MAALQPPAHTARTAQSPRPSLIDLGPASLLQALVSLIAAPALNRIAHSPVVKAFFSGRKSCWQPPAIQTLQKRVARYRSGLKSRLRRVPVLIQTSLAIMGLIQWRGPSMSQREVNDVQPTAGQSLAYVGPVAAPGFDTGRLQKTQTAVRDRFALGQHGQQWYNSGGGPMTIFIQQPCGCPLTRCVYGLD